MGNFGTTPPFFTGESTGGSTGGGKGTGVKRCCLLEKSWLQVIMYHSSTGKVLDGDYKFEYGACIKCHIEGSPISEGAGDDREGCYNLLSGPLKHEPEITITGGLFTNQAAAECKFEYVTECAKLLGHSHWQDDKLVPHSCSAFEDSRAVLGSFEYHWAEACYNEYLCIKEGKPANVPGGDQDVGGKQAQRFWKLLQDPSLDVDDQTFSQATKFRRVMKQMRLNLCPPRKDCKYFKKDVEKCIKNKSKK